MASLTICTLACICAEVSDICSPSKNGMEIFPSVNHQHQADLTSQGNYIGSRHFTVGGYDKIARTLFGELRVVDTFYLEYDDSRSGGFEPLRHLPADKNVILGIVTTKSPQLEDLATLKARVHEVARYVAEGSGQTPEQALERLGVSPQCGFASHVLGNALTEEDMFAKLKLVRQVADEIWHGHP